MTYNDYIELVNDPHRPWGAIGPCLIDRGSARVQAGPAGLPPTCSCGGRVFAEDPSRQYGKCMRCGSTYNTAAGRRATVGELRQRARLLS